MYPVEIAKVVATLGGVGLIGPHVEDLPTLSASVARGFPRAVVQLLASQAAPAAGPMRTRVAALVASPATLKRSPRLSPQASARAERLARIIALAHQALGGLDEARTWLSEPHPMLAATPIEHAATDLGARQVERLLHDIEHDLPA